MPYLCISEEETWQFDNEENSLQDSVPGILSIMLYYLVELKDENKLNYWRNRLLMLASSGNYMAQGLICWGGCYFLKNGTYEGILPQTQWEELKKTYEEKLLQQCEQGEPYAQLAVGVYNRNIDDKEKERLLLSAIEKGLTDACYYYIKFLSQKRFIANGFTVDLPNYSTQRQEWEDYMRDELQLYKKGAELNNGVMAGYCQYRLADMYENGDGGVFKDASMAQVWYKKSYENGYTKSKMHIKD